MADTLTSTDLRQPLKFLTFGNPPPEINCGYATDVGHENNQTSQQLGGTEVPTATDGEDIGVIARDNIKVGALCD